MEAVEAVAAVQSALAVSIGREAVPWKASVRVMGGEGGGYS